jgi:hypothetical protein
VTVLGHLDHQYSTLLQEQLEDCMVVWGGVFWRPVGMHLKLLLCLSEQEPLLSLSAVFLLLGKTEFGLSGLKLTTLSSV